MARGILEILIEDVEIIANTIKLQQEEIEYLKAIVFKLNSERNSGGLW